MRVLIVLGSAAIIFAATISAFAVGLTDADFDYLATQNIAKERIVLLNLSPKEQARLHGIINYVSSARAKDVIEALDGFIEHQRWEQQHPGELWDQPRPVK